MAVTYEPIASTTTSSNASSVTFSGIAAYTDLVLVVVGTTNIDDFVYLQIGNSSVDTGSNYSQTRLRGTGSAASSLRASGATSIQLSSGNTTILTTQVVHIMSHANTNVYKTVLIANAGDNAARVVGLWRSTSAVDVIKVYTPASYFTNGTTISLYGIKAA